MELRACIALASVCIGCVDIERVEDAPFAVVALNDRSGAKLCSGVVISDRRVATAKHCAADGIVHHRGMTFVRWFPHDERDLAVIEVVSTDGYPQARIAPTLPDDGDRIVRWGYGCDGRLSPHAHAFARVSDRGDGGSSAVDLRADGSACDGDSGGAWLDTSGDLIAIHSATIQDGGIVGADASNLHALMHD